MMPSIGLHKLADVGFGITRKLLYVDLQPAFVTYILHDFYQMFLI